jgi:hypothetical protein
MKRFKTKLKHTKNGLNTEWPYLFDNACCDCMYCIWDNYPHKSAYVAQVAFYEQRYHHKRYNLECVKRGDKIYLVRKEIVGIFRTQH